MITHSISSKPLLNQQRV